MGQTLPLGGMFTTIGWDKFTAIGFRYLKLRHLRVLNPTPYSLHEDQIMGQSGSRMASYQVGHSADYLLPHGVSVYTQLPGDPTNGQTFALRPLHRLPSGRLQRRGLLAPWTHSFANSSVPLRPEVATGCIVVQSRQLGLPFATQTIGGLMDDG